MTTTICIANTTIHQDTDGRYSLNDLHQAAGGEQRHRPKYWLELQQTNDLIDEILKGGFPPFKNNAEISNAQIRAIKNGDNSNSANSQNYKPVISKTGRYGGTYVCKELVYSYAMWISAAFALKVIRAYDDLVTGKIESKKPAKSLPGKITADQQEAIKQLVLSRGRALPKERQAKAMITMWSALKTHFGVSYKEIDSEQFTEALSLAARIPLEGELLERAMLPCVEQKFMSDADWRQVVNNINAACIHIEHINTAWRTGLYDALYKLGSPLSHQLNDRIVEGLLCANLVKSKLERVSGLSGLQYQHIGRQ